MLLTGFASPVRFTLHQKSLFTRTLSLVPLCSVIKEAAKVARTAAYLNADIVKAVNVER